VPTEVITPLLFDGEDHRIDPVGVLERRITTLLRIDNILEEVATLECIAVGTDRTRDLVELGSDLAVLGWYPICVSRHF
jgi:hypothetical protein